MRQTSVAMQGFTKTAALRDPDDFILAILTQAPKLEQAPLATVVGAFFGHTPTRKQFELFVTLTDQEAKEIRKLLEHELKGPLHDWKPVREQK
jgi:hypothetical protein